MAAGRERTPAAPGAPLMEVPWNGYQHLHGVSSAYQSLLENVDWTVAFCFLAMIPAGFVVLVLTRPQKRQEALRQMLNPAVAVGGILVLNAPLTLLTWLNRGIGNNAAVGLPLAVVGLTFIFWFLAFGLRAFYLLATGLFRLGDGHPLLPPVIGTLAAWTFAIKSLIAGGSAGAPTAVEFFLLRGGPASITALAIAEVMRLRSQYPADFPFRDGPLLVRVGDPTPPG